MCPATATGTGAVIYRWRNDEGEAGCEGVCPLQHRGDLRGSGDMLQHARQAPAGGEDSQRPRIGREVPPFHGGGDHEVLEELVMRSISNSDYMLALRLLRHLSSMRVDGTRDREARRKAALLARKLDRRGDGRLD